MNKYILSLFVLCFSISVFSQEDTTFVQAHDYVDLDWNGNYDAWGVFPDGTESYRKVLMHYDMRCSSSGCSGWDYTTNVNLKKRFQDSTNICPNYIINGDGVFKNSIHDAFCWAMNSSF